MLAQSELQKFLRGNSLQLLEDTFKINVKRHPDYSNLVHFKYDQVHSPTYHPVVRCSRSVILDESKNWATVSYPFDRFFNVGDQNCDVIDWSTARWYDKADGSIMILYHYNNKWHVSSSGMPAADGNLGDWNVKFSEHFWKIWKDLCYKDPTNTDISYMFELCSMENLVVCRHPTPRIVFLGGRNRQTHQEFFPETIANPEWELVQTYDIHNLDAFLEFAKTLDPLVKEGGVCCDANFNRMKLKSEQYVRISHLRDSIANSPKALLEVVRKNESTEFLIYFPSFEESYRKIENSFMDLETQIESIYSRIKHHITQKEFAAEATKYKFSSLMFSLRAGKTKSIKHFLSEMRIDTLADWVEIEKILKKT